jgi:hypothetical protein
MSDRDIRSADALPLFVDRYVTPKSSSICSSDRPLVSGTKNQTNKNMEKQNEPYIKNALTVSRAFGGVTYP